MKIILRSSAGYINTFRRGVSPGRAALCPRLPGCASSEHLGQAGQFGKVSCLLCLITNSSALKSRGVGHDRV